MKNSTNNHETLQALVGRAIVDPAFRKDLLNGHRADCLSEYDLSADEWHAASAIQAEDLPTFARKLDTWICSDTHRSSQVSTMVSSGRVPMVAAVA